MLSNHILVLPYPIWILYIDVTLSLSYPIVSFPAASLVAGSLFPQLAAGLSFVPLLSWSVTCEVFSEGPSQARFFAFERLLFLGLSDLPEGFIVRLKVILLVSMLCRPWWRDPCPRVCPMKGSASDSVSGEEIHVRGWCDSYSTPFRLPLLFQAHWCFRCFCCRASTSTDPGDVKPRIFWSTPSIRSHRVLLRPWWRDPCPRVCPMKGSASEGDVTHTPFRLPPPLLRTFV